MIQYKQTSEGYFIIDVARSNGEIVARTIPNDKRNKDFRLMNELVSSGEAEIIPMPVDLENHKKEKKNAIDLKTDTLIDSGFSHNSVEFKITMHKQIAALALMIKRMNAQNMSGAKFRGRNRGYVFEDDADFDAMFNTGFARIQALIDAGSDLKDAVDDCTTVAEVDAISDDRA